MTLPFKKLYEIKESKGLFEIKAKFTYTWKLMEDIDKGQDKGTALYMIMMDDEIN